MTLWVWIIGGLSIGAHLCAVIWSIIFPERRLWPVTKSTVFNQICIWGTTTAAFLALIYIGVSDWNALGFPISFRWGLGGALILFGNIVVWKEVVGIGWKATSGGIGRLKTNGFYNYSRNPQYVADIAMITGWVILSGSQNVLPFAALGILVFTLAPFAEEPWLTENYGHAYETYKKRVPRFFGLPKE